ncbi:hypothetical protein AC249_AIPGENE10918 [Exaiptasia diaphana]|nr:hypothetical protein AC249_AIPGENE10918 [Exaiptasia diaphana]
MDDTGSLGQMNENFEDDIETQDFDDLIFALKTGGHFDPSEEEKPSFDQQEHFELRVKGITDRKIWFVAMNFKFLCVLCLIFVLVVPDADGFLWGRRRRRRRRRVPVGLCRRYGCWTHCGVRCRYIRGKFRCSRYCGRKCGWRLLPCRKGDEPEQDEPAYEDPVEDDPQLPEDPQALYQNN